jgi:hypothetical protein
MSQINSKVYEEKAAIIEPVYEAPKLNLIAKQPSTINRTAVHETKAKPEKTEKPDKPKPEPVMHASTQSFSKNERTR